MLDAPTSPVSGWSTVPSGLMVIRSLGFLAQTGDASIDAPRGVFDGGDGVSAGESSKSKIGCLGGWVGVSLASKYGVSGSRSDAD